MPPIRTPASNHFRVVQLQKEARTRETRKRDREAKRTRDSRHRNRDASKRDCDASTIRDPDASTEHDRDASKRDARAEQTLPPSEPATPRPTRMVRRTGASFLPSQGTREELIAFLVRKDDVIRGLRDRVVQLQATIGELQRKLMME
jgi:hypothetical protein